MISLSNLFKIFTKSKRNQEARMKIFMHFGEKSIDYSGAAARISIRGGDILGGRPSRGSGGRSPPEVGEFSKILKNSQENYNKCTVLAYFSKKVNEPCVNFSHVWTKIIIVWETIEKILKIFVRKQQKCILLAYFSKIFNKPCVNISGVWTKKHKLWRTFEKLSKVFKKIIKKIAKNPLFQHIFLKN